MGSPQSICNILDLARAGVEMIVNHKGEVLTAAHPSAAGKKGLPTFVDDANSPLELAILSPHDGATHFFARATANGGGTDVPLYLTLQSSTHLGHYANIPCICTT